MSLPRRASIYCALCLLLAVVGLVARQPLAALILVTGTAMYLGASRMLTGLTGRDRSS